MRVLVTGAAGLLGRAVLDALSGTTFDVQAVDRTPRPPEIAAEAYTCCDLQTWNGLDDAMARADALVHLAAIPNLDTLAEEEVYRLNTALDARVTFAALRNGVERLVYASSQTAYGYALAAEPHVPDDLPVTEDHRTRSSDGYGMSKLAGEGMCRLFAARSGGSAIALRFPVIWHHDRFAAHVAKRQGDPDQAAKSWWSYVDSRDAGTAVRLALRARISGAQVYNIGAAFRFGAPDLGSIWPALYRRAGETVTDSGPLFDISRARRDLEYLPRYRWTQLGVKRLCQSNHLE